MARSRDLFANFERMRREIDELFGDVFERATGLRGGGFSPSVDVFYVDDPAARRRQGRSGGHPHPGHRTRDPRPPAPDRRRAPPGRGGRAALPADRDRARPVPASGRAGRRGGGRPGARQLRGRDPRGRDSARSREQGPARADRRGRARVSIHIPSADGEAAQAVVQYEPARGAAGAAAARHRALPRDAHAAGDRPGAIDQPRERRARRQPDARDGGEQGPGDRGARARRRLPGGRGRRGVAHAQGARRHAADPRARRPARGDREVREHRALHGRPHRGGA